VSGVLTETAKVMPESHNRPFYFLTFKTLVERPRDK